MYTGNKCIYIHLYIPSNLIPGLKGGPPYWSTIFNYLPKCVTMLMSHPHSYPEGPLFKAFQFPHDVCWSRPANSGSTILPVCLLNVKSCYLPVFSKTWGHMKEARTHLRIHHAQTLHTLEPQSLLKGHRPLRKFLIPTRPFRLLAMQHRWLIILHTRAVIS